MEPSTDRLASARAKLCRAKTHVDKLRAEMRDACDGKAPRVSATRRKFDPDTQQVLFIAERVPEIGDDWSLRIGDALHNLRCALDHLWWQLAIDHLGRKPTPKEAKRIQFPILEDADEWEGHRFLELVDEKAADKAKVLQAYDRGDDQIPYLGILGLLSNYDKHREMHVAFFVSSGGGLATPTPDQCIDCRIPRRVLDGKEVWMMHVSWGDPGFPGEIKTGDVVMGIEVIPTGPNPDIDIEPQITGQIAFRNHEPVLPILDQLGRLVSWTLDDFAPLLSGPGIQDDPPPDEDAPLWGE